MNLKHLLITAFISLAAAAGAILVYDALDEEGQPREAMPVQTEEKSTEDVQFTRYDQPSQADSAPYTPTGSHVNLDFTKAASVSTPSVVHIKTKVHRSQSSRGLNPLRYFFDEDEWHGPHRSPNRPRQGSGSGVIVSPEGYIATNNHVINNADEIEVVLHNKRSYTAERIGSDPMTDIALLKIDENNLPAITMGNSDSVQIGEWVLAVGNPFNLSSTVTAGIVSAKARNINILRDRAAIESFIQTDAAVNPGNSGGALVNLDGELIGINTAIASPSGTYAGYAFAVPVNLVAKIVQDLKKYGIVQRGYLGVNIRNLDNQTADELGVNTLKGVYVAGIQSGSAADDAGLQEGDVIIGVNNESVESAPELQEKIAQFRPGDEVTIRYLRNGNKRETLVTLKNKHQNTQLLTKQKVEVVDLLGAEFTALSSQQKEELGVESGVQVTKLSEGSIRKYTNMREGFVITHVEKRSVNSVDELIEVIENNEDDGVMVQGFYPGYKGTYYYAFGLK